MLFDAWLEIVLAVGRMYRQLAYIFVADRWA